MKTVIIEKSPLREIECIFDFKGDIDPKDPAFAESFRRSLLNGLPNFREKVKTEDSENDLQFGPSNRSISIRLSKQRLLVRQEALDTTWTKFKEVVNTILDIYHDEAKPTSITNVFLGYVNAFNMPEEPMHYDEFLTVHPVLTPGKRDLAWAHWAQTVTLIQEDIKAAFIVTTGTGPGTKDSDADVFLDLSMTYLFKHGEEDIPKQDVPDWLDAAHQEIRSTFLASLTDASKKSIGYKEVDGEDNK